MNSPAARYGFAADPRALADLRALPNRVRDLVLLGLQDLVHGEQRGPRLGQRSGVDLSDCRKLYADPGARWRIVYQERQAPPSSTRDREIYFITVGPRREAEVYNTAAHRLRRPVPPHHHHARSETPPAPAPQQTTTPLERQPR